MAILAECPICHTKQSVRNKTCKCNADLDREKKNKRVRYWISYYFTDENGNRKQKRESVGAFKDLDPYSIKDARDAESKRTVQKREKDLFDLSSKSKITFKELTDWYTKLKKVKKLASYNRVKLCLENFNTVYSDQQVNSLILTDLENYQELRADQGKAPATIDMEISILKTMITKAFYDDKVDGRVLKPFMKLDRKLRKGANAREQTITVEQYLKLKDNALPHLRACLIIAFNTGMRTGEIRLLKWQYIDREAGFIRLPAKVTKEGKKTGQGKIIPINHHVQAVLQSLPRALMHDYVITYRGNRIKQKDGLKRSFKSACEKAKLPNGSKTKNGIIFHDIRRTVKTNMVNAGVDKAHRDTILGHSLQGMDRHYIKPTERDLKEAMDKYTLWIDQQLEGAIRKLSESIDHSIDQAKNN